MGFDWRPLRKGGLRGAYFHEICKCASALCADLVDHISRISSNVRGIYGWKFIYAGKRGHGFHCADFHGTQNFSINVCGYSSRPTEFYRNRTKNVENTSNFFFKPVSKEYVSLHRYRRNSQVFNGIMWIYSTRNFTRFCQEVWKVRVEIRLNLLSKVWMLPRQFTKLALTAH